MKRRWGWARGPAAWVFAAVLLSGAGGPAVAACKIASIEVPVVLTPERILIPAVVAGRRVFFIYDTGAAYSMLFSGTASLLSMGTREQNGLYLFGAGGGVRARSVMFKDLQLGEFHLRDQQMLIVDGHGHSFEHGDEVIGLAGADIFGGLDVEFDLANRKLRLMRPSGCTDQDMPYWASAYSEMPIKWEREGGNVDVDVMLNGSHVEGVLDTGSPISIVSLPAAERVGVTPHTPGVKPVGQAGGIGDARSSAWIADFDSLSLGDEKVNHVKLRIADIFSQDVYYELGSRLPRHIIMPRMLVGLDFFRAHRVLISRSHNKVFFSYNGGPIFQADEPLAAAATRQANSSPSGGGPSGSPPY